MREKRGEKRGRKITKRRELIMVMARGRYNAHTCHVHAQANMPPLSFNPCQAQSVGEESQTGVHEAEVVVGV